MVWRECLQLEQLLCGLRWTFICNIVGWRSSIGLDSKRLCIFSYYSHSLSCIKYMWTLFSSGDWLRGPNPGQYFQMCVREAVCGRRIYSGMDLVDPSERSVGLWESAMTRLYVGACCIQCQQREQTETTFEPWKRIDEIVKTSSLIRKLVWHFQPRHWTAGAEDGRPRHVKRILKVTSYSRSGVSRFERIGQVH